MRKSQIKEFVKELVEQLTLDEKISMIHGAELFRTAGIPRLGIPPLTFSDGTMGVRRDFEKGQWKVTGRNDDFAAYLPCESAMAATWNPDLAEQIGEVLGEEARGRGKDVILAPGLNIKRSPLCGRNFEYFSEDPLLSGEMAAAYIRGIQKMDVAACPKHFAVNNQETERLWVEAEADEEALKEIYLKPFLTAIKKGNPYSIMAAYNKLWGEHCGQNKRLLEDILRKEWGYDGVVVSDWGGIHDTKKAAESELDVEMSVTDDFDQYCMADPLKKAVEDGTVSETRLDRKAEHILTMMVRLHMLDGKRKKGAFNTPEHRSKALKAARESIVLLKNERKRLPIDPAGLKRLLVIGENADRIHSEGGGSAEVRALYEITPLTGIKMFLGGNTSVEYVKGYCSDPKEKASDTNWQETSLENGGGGSRKEKQYVWLEAERQRLAREAVEKAAEYEQVIFIGGLNHDQDSEGNDREDMKLPYGQDSLICELLKVNPQMTVVLTGGSPVEMGEWIDQAKAVVWGWYGGMEGGRALAEVLFGNVNPSGKLPETFYKKHTDCSAHCIGEFGEKEKVRYKEGLLVGYRYNDTCQVPPQFCFGHGLSYTSFRYGDLSICELSDRIRISCELTNIGTVSGKETVQVYVNPVQRLKGHPRQELAGFKKVELAPGETRQVIILIEKWNEPVRLNVGSSIGDIRQSILYQGGRKGENL